MAKKKDELTGGMGAIFGGASSPAPKSTETPIAEKTVGSNIVLPFALHQRVKMLSVKKNKKIKELMAEALEQYCDREEE